MKSNIKYIDKLTSDKLKNFESLSQTSWDRFNENNSAKLIIEENTNLGISSYLTTRNVMFTVAGISIFTAGILLYGNENNSRRGLKSINKDVNTESLYEVPNLNSKIDNTDIFIVNNDINTKDSTLIKQDKEEHVVIRVEVPVVKNVKINEKVYINDPNLQEDTVIIN